MLIKVCGLTNSTTAHQAALNGIDFIGLLFTNKSIRQINLATAIEIAQSARLGGAEVVGVFYDEELTQIINIANVLQLTTIQLHGDKVRKYCAQLSQYKIIYVVDGEPIPKDLDHKKDMLLFENIDPQVYSENIQHFQYFIAGGINSKNVLQKIDQHHPHGIDLSSSLENIPSQKDIKLIKKFVQTIRKDRYGKFGGCYVPELLIEPLQELAQKYLHLRQNSDFNREYLELLKNYCGRPTALTEVRNFAQKIGGARIFLKREDLLHTGAHKINNAIGQCLIAKHMGKTRIIAETGAGQHGVATATACAMFGLECTIYMGEIDIVRQAPNVAKMRLLGATVIPVTYGAQTLKDAVNAALRDWASSYETTHYCLGSALGPYPFPQIVADFQSIIGREAKQQFNKIMHKNPDKIIACVGGGSNAIGIFKEFIEDSPVELIGVEAGGTSPALGNNAARFSAGRLGVLHGCATYLLQDENGQVANTHSISAGLDYPAVGPEHSYLFAINRVQYVSVTDKEALSAFLLLTQTEGIIPALESSHALAYAIKMAKTMSNEESILINLSGRGDKDLPQLLAGELSYVAH